MMNFKACKHGFPYRPQCMAFDSVQSLLAIATQENVPAQPTFTDIHIYTDRDPFNLYSTLIGPLIYLYIYRTRPTD